MTWWSVNDLSIDSDPSLYQVTYQREISNSVTGYGGMQASTDYYALQIGAAVWTRIGALLADVTKALVHIETTEKRANEGQSYQLSYRKYLPDSNSNLTIVAYRYSTEGYYDYLTAMRGEHWTQRNMVKRQKISGVLAIGLTSP